MLKKMAAVPVLLLAVLLAGFAPANQEEPALQAPRFELKDGEGRSFALSGPRDKPLLLHFWASWCGPCGKEAPVLQKLAGEFASSLDVYAVNVTASDNREAAEKFVLRHEWTMPVLYDTDGEVFRKYQGQAFPTSVFITRQGRLFDISLGALPEEELKGRMERLIAAE